MKPSIPIATVKLLERLGCTVEFPRSQTCCGQIMTNTGYFDEAIPTVRKSYVQRASATTTTSSARPAPASGRCGTSTRCWPGTPATPGSRRRPPAVAARTYELTEFIVDVLGVTDVGAYFPHRVTYHPTCHSMRITKVGDRPLQLLRAVRGIDLVDLPKAEQCCGFGGTFSVKNPAVSIAMASDKARHVRSTDAEYLVAGDHACLMNIGGVLHRQRAGIKTIHLAEILATTERMAQR